MLLFVARAGADSAWLSQLPNEFIHQPWKAPPGVLEEAGEGRACHFPTSVLLFLVC
jgi:hypothetical protein